MQEEQGILVQQFSPYLASSGKDLHSSLLKTECSVSAVYSKHKDVIA